MPRRRYELTDELHERIEHLLPEVEGRGCPCNDHQKVINGILQDQSASGLPDGMYQKDTATGGRHTIAPDAGPLVSPLSRLHGTCKASST